MRSKPSMCNIEATHADFFQSLATSEVRYPSAFEVVPAPHSDGTRCSRRGRIGKHGGFYWCSIITGQSDQSGCWDLNHSVSPQRPRYQKVSNSYPITSEIYSTISASIGLVGFEPTASWSRTRRSTKLSHSPNSHGIKHLQTISHPD